MSSKDRVETSHITHVAMAKGLPGITPKEAKGSRLNELQAMALDPKGKPIPGFIAFDFGSKALKLVFTAKDENEQLCVPVVDTSKLKSSDVFKAYNEYLKGPSKANLAAVYAAADAFLSAYCAENSTTRVRPSVVVTQGGSTFINAGKLNSEFKNNAEAAMAETFQGAEIIAQPEKKGLAGNQRARIWWACQNEETKIAVASPLETGVVILWSGRIVSGMDPKKLANGEFFPLDFDRLSYAQCEATSLNFVAAVMEAAQQAKSGTLIVLEPGSGNPGFTVVNPGEAATFASWPKGIKGLEAKDGKALKPVMEAATTDGETDFAPIHQKAQELAEAGLGAFNGLRKDTPVPAMAVVTHMNFYQQVASCAPSTTADLGLPLAQKRIRSNSQEPKLSDMETVAGGGAGKAPGGGAAAQRDTSPEGSLATQVNFRRAW